MIPLFSHQPHRPLAVRSLLLGALLCFMLAGAALLAAEDAAHKGEAKSGEVKAAAQPAEAKKDKDDEDKKADAHDDAKAGAKKDADDKKDEAKGEEKKDKEKDKGDEAKSDEIKPADMQAKVKLASVREGRIPLTLMALGKIEAPRQRPASIMALAPGVVIKIHVKDGDAVTSGAVLMSLDSRAVRAELQKARSALALAESELHYAEKSGLDQEQEDLDLAVDQAKVKSQQAAKEFERLTALFAKSLVSEKAVTEARQAAGTSQREAGAAAKKAALFRASGRTLEMDRLRAKIEEARSAVRLSEIEDEATTVRSPLAGRVTRVHAAMGQSVDKGAMLIELVGNQEIGVTFALPPQQALNIKRAMPFTLEDTPTSRTFEGSIVAMGAGIDAESGLVRIEGVLAIKGGMRPYLGEVMPGAITVGTSQPGAIVPLTALTTSDEGTFVHRVDEKHQAHQTEVQVLARTRHEAVVTAAELKPGARIVSDGNYNLPDGAAVVEEGQAAEEKHKTEEKQTAEEKK